jgi:two-component system, NtrC family, sensor kinase
LLSYFHNLSVRYKLTLIAMLTCTVALFLACTGFAIYDYVSVRNDMSARLVTQSRIIGGNSTAAIAFDNATDATSTLATLAAEPGIRAGCIYGADGRKLAAYTTHDFGAYRFPDRPRGDRIWFTSDSLQLFQQIELDGKVIGTVYLYSGLDALHARMKRYALIGGGLTLLAAAVAFLLVSRLQRYISGPIRELADVARRVSEKKDYTLRAPRRGRDEVGVLIDCFNSMIDALEQSYKTVEQQVLDRTRELQETQKKLVDTARAAGMAEVATSVLHNVGNVLNSVNVSTGIVSDKVRQSSVKNLARAVGLMEERSGDLARFITEDDRGRQIPGYLTVVTDVLMQEQKALIEELGSLAKNIEHIKQIVQVQQSFAKSSGVIEEVDLKTLIEDALRVNVGSLERHDIAIRRFIEDLPPINTDKHSVLQILINLISNAKHAVHGVCDRAKQITVRAAQVVCEGGPQIRIEVEDNGSGIAPENINRIFSHGFTTKRDGHGFGLHSAANSAKQLGGTLLVHSDGPGKGAMFTLALPYSSEKVTV